jgi:hypothetical protein
MKILIHKKEEVGEEWKPKGGRTQKNQKKGKGVHYTLSISKFLVSGYRPVWKIG